MKKCFKCEKTKPIGDFYDHPAMADGKLGKCKECSKVDVRTNRAKRRAYYSEYEKIRSQREERKRDAAANLQNSRKKNPDQFIGRWCHVGRVNTPGRFEMFEELGADSCDGTGLAQYQHMRKAILMNKTNPTLFDQHGVPVVVPGGER